MKQYSKELKDSAIGRMLPPNNVSVPDLVRETGIPKDTLYSWRSKARNGNPAVESPLPGELSSDDKFNAVLEAASMNEIELGEYCRRKGLFPQQISLWREVCQQAHAPLTVKKDRQLVRAQKKEIKRLEGDLRRKEKALAEAAALLVLQKKIRDLWEEPKDGNSAILNGNM